MISTENVSERTEATEDSASIETKAPQRFFFESLDSIRRRLLDLTGRN